MFGKKEGLNWRKCTNPYRENIDLATLFIAWSRYESGLNPYEKLDEITIFFRQENMLHVSPRELWGNILGSGKLKAGELVSAEDIIHTKFGFRARNIEDKDRNVFDMGLWMKECDKAFRTSTPCRDFSLTWMLRYRRALDSITYFSDYRVRKSNGKCHLVFMENHADPMRDASWKVDIDDGDDDDLELLEGLAPNGRYRNHPILGDVAYTHTFVNLDALVDACDQHGYAIPDVFRRPESFNNARVNKFRMVDFKFKLAPDEQFIALLITERVQEFLTLDPEGFLLLSQKTVKPLKAELRKRITAGLGKTDDNLVDHIWAVLMPIEGDVRRGKGKKLIRGNLLEVMQCFWGEGEEDKWVRDVRKDRLEQLNADGYNSNEAKAILAMITPEGMQGSGKPSKHLLGRCREQILAMDLSWLEKDFP